MSDSEPTLSDRIEEYQDLCEREGELLAKLRPLRIDKARLMARINHDLGKRGRAARDGSYEGLYGQDALPLDSDREGEGGEA
jgi:hypothetical protein